MTRKLAIFDFNGTILDDARICVIAGNAELEYLGKPPISLKRMQDTFDFPMIHYFERHGVNAAQFLEHIDTLKEIFYKTYGLYADTARTRPGTRKVLDWLVAEGYDLIILSNELQENLDKQLKRLKLESCFKAVLGNDKSGLATHKLNKQERLEAFLKKHDYNKGQTFIIGDSREEPEIARNLGFKCISISGGHIAGWRLKKCHPDALVSSMNAALKILKDWD